MSKEDLTKNDQQDLEKQEKPDSSGTPNQTPQATKEEVQETSKATEEKPKSEEQETNKTAEEDKIIIKEENLQAKNKEQPKPQEIKKEKNLTKAELKRRKKIITPEEYNQYVKEVVEDKSYFKDALDWYLFRYISPICDRTLLIFGAMIACVVLFFLVELVQNAFPLVETKPIFISSKDQSLYVPKLVELKPKKGELHHDPNILSVDESVAKYLLANYVSEREGYDFSKGKIIKVNNKINRIRNNSSAKEYRAFQRIMSKDNPASPIQNFGKNIKKTVQIISVKFERQEEDNFALKAKNFIFHKIPTSAKVRFNTTTKIGQEDGTYKNENEAFVAQIIFDFDGISNEEDSKKSLNFAVQDYKLFRVKN